MTWQELIELGRQAWPDVKATRDDLERRLPELPPAVAHGEDLFLALACVAGDAAALAALDRNFLSQIGGYLQRVPGASAIAADVRQMLAEKLLVGTRPRLLDYAGAGPLGAWLRVAAIRTAIDLLRSRGDEVGARGDVAERLVGGENAETSLVKQRYRETFQTALDAALVALEPRQRQLLRMHLVDGITLDRLAVAHQVHRSTVARWIADARAQVVAGIRARVEASLGLSDAEFDSLLELIKSQLHVSLARLEISAP